MRWSSRFLLIIAIAFTAFFFTEYGQHKNAFHADSLGYYSYLPSFFNLKNFDSINSLPQNGTIPGSVLDYFNTRVQLRAKSKKGYAMAPYSYGVAFFQLPFYAIAEGFFWIKNIKSTGYSDLHHSMIVVSNFFYVFLGLLLIFRILSRAFNVDTALFTVSMLLLASNLFWFTTLQFGMAHPVIFFLVALLIYTTVLFYDEPSFLKAGLIFFTLGFITIIRPTDILFALIPIGYNIRNLQDIKERLRLIRVHIKKIICTAPLFIVPFLPQLLYWKKYSGSFLFYSYAGEGFDFLHPRLFDGLLGPNNGWLLYSPIWILAIAILFTKKDLKGFKSTIVLLLPVYIYLIYSWSCYQYINGFGSRPMLHMYPLLAIPLATTIEAAFKLKWSRVVLIGVCSFLVYHNLHFSYLTQSGKYWSDFSNYTFYRRMMFRSNLSYNDIVIKDSELLQPRAASLKKVANLADLSVQEDSNYAHVFDLDLQDSVIVVPEGEEGPKLKLNVSLDPFLHLNGCFIKASGVVKFSRHMSDPYHGIILVHKLEENGKQISWNGCNLYTKMGLPNNRELEVDSIWLHGGAPYIWDTVSFYIPVPRNYKTLISKVDIWNISKMKFYVQNLKIELVQKNKL